MQLSLYQNSFPSENISFYALFFSYLMGNDCVSPRFLNYIAVTYNSLFFIISSL